MKPAKQLAIAAASGNEAEVRRMLKEDPALAKDWQPMMDACFQGNADIVALLLRHGADANVLAKSSHKYRPLHRTVETKKMTPRGPAHLKTVELLLQHGADPMQRGTCTQITAIAVAALGGENQFLPLLTKGRTPDLFTASVVGDEKRVRALLAKDCALAQAKDENGWNALRYAAQSRVGGRDPKLATSLLAIAELLLEAGSSTESVLDPVCWAGNLAMVKLLLKHGAKLEMGDTLNHGACDGHFEILEALLAHGADLNDCRGTEHHGGYTPLGCTITLASERGARWFLDHGVDPNKVGGPKGETALHLAVQRGCGLPMLELLVERGVRLNAKDADGKTALDLAKAGKSAKTVDYLKRVSGS